MEFIPLSVLTICKLKITKHLDQIFIVEAYVNKNFFLVGYQLIYV